MNTQIHLRQRTFLIKDVTFSHVSGEPMSHVPSAKVEHGSEVTDITENLVQFHGSCQSEYNDAECSLNT